MRKLCSNIFYHGHMTISPAQVSFLRIMIADILLNIAASFFIEKVAKIVLFQVVEVVGSIRVEFVSNPNEKWRILRKVE